MPDIVFYLKIRDTADANDLAAQQRAVQNLADQLLAAAQKVKENKDAIWDYVWQDSPCSPSRSGVETYKPIVASLSPPPVTSHVSSISSPDGMVEEVFKTLKRTKKSETIVDFFVQNSGTDVSLDDIVLATGISKPDVGVWICQTGRKVPAITCTGRGLYKFNPNLLINQCPQTQLSHNPQENSEPAFHSPSL